MTKSKLLAAALAVALCAPQAAFAARDGEGMEYTSASEGFYGSLRTYYSSNGAVKDNGGEITADSSRLGVRGSLDLGHGLTGLYRYEWSVDGENGDAVGNTRLSYVGLRGGFGEFQVGSLWENDYNWVTAATDVATTGSGNFAPHFRRKNQFQYSLPDVNGFQASFRFGMDGEGKNDGDVETATGMAMAVRITTAGMEHDAVNLTGFGGDVNISVSAIPPLFNAAPTTTLSFRGAEVKGSQAVDEWAIAAKYSTHGFTFGGAYEVAPDKRGYRVPADLSALATNPTEEGLSVFVNIEDNRDQLIARNGTELRKQLEVIDQDQRFWAFRIGYGHDNWGVNAWYGIHNTSERGIVAADVNNGAAAARGYKPDDTTIYSIAGNIDMGKVAIVGIYEQKENQWKQEDNVFLLNADYKFTSRSKAYIAYIANDFQTNPNKDDEVRIGLRMDF
ncbi:MAG: porin [Gammaproteobacteria bacterium]